MTGLLLSKDTYKYHYHTVDNLRSLVFLYVGYTTSNQPASEKVALKRFLWTYRILSDPTDQRNLFISFVFFAPQFLLRPR
jgi:hypothetical protein